MVGERPILEYVGGSPIGNVLLFCAPLSPDLPTSHICSFLSGEPGFPKIYWSMGCRTQVDFETLGTFLLGQTGNVGEAL